MQKAAILTVLALAIGTALYQAQRAGESQKRLAKALGDYSAALAAAADLRRRLEDALKTEAALRAENERLRSEAAEIHRLRAEVTRLRASPPGFSKPLETGPDGTLAAAAKSWQDRVSLLRQRFEETPDKKIPEFRLLNDDDWLLVAKYVMSTDEDYRRAMSTLRSTAEDRFARKLQPALQKFIAAHGEQIPSDISQLAEYISNPEDQAILSRYAIFPAQGLTGIGLPGTWFIAAAELVDRQFDSRLFIAPNVARRGRFGPY